GNRSPGCDRQSAPVGTGDGREMGGQRLWMSAMGDRRARGPSMNNCATLDADASRLAALLVAYILPVCALLAPCHAGASTPRDGALILGRALPSFSATPGPRCGIDYRHMTQVIRLLCTLALLAFATTGPMHA